MAFNILSSAHSLNRHHLIEASAGTGKTFTIEHLFVRRLIEPTIDGNYISAPQIAVLTFTRAVARELSSRIRRSLDQAISSLNGPLEDTNRAEYLEPHASARLQLARSELEGASITTIHGFCFKMLRGFAREQGKSGESILATTSQMRQMVEEFFLTELPEDRYSVQQLARILEKYNFDFRLLCQEVLSRLSGDWFSETPIENIEQPLARLNQLIDSMKKEQGWTSHTVYDDLDALSHHFTGFRTRAGELKEDHQTRFLAFSKLFDTQADFEAIIRSPLIATSLFATPKAAKKNGDLRMFPHLLQFEPLLAQLGDPEILMQQLVRRCRNFVRGQLVKRELFSHDELLYQMDKALDQESFRQFLARRFSCVIVDEFQDTDPLQWKIISKAVLEQKKTTVYLVGDPKQAIYSFRRADVYNYMQAKKELQDAYFGSLVTNFRSTPRLVSALNTLFSHPHSTHLFFLPRAGISLDAPSLASSQKEPEVLLDDARAPIHFFVAKESIGKKQRWPTQELEEAMLFPFIAREIAQLTSKQIRYSQCAILVKDRYQAGRIENYLSSANIPARARRQGTVIGSKAHLFLEGLIALLLAPRDKSRLMHFVIQEPLSYSRIDDDTFSLWARHVEHVLHLRKSYDEGGLPALLQLFLTSCWPESDVTMEEMIRALPEGVQILRDLEQLFDFLVQKIPYRMAALDKVADALLELKEFSKEEQEELSCHFDYNEDAVHIVTLHSSKGLEFSYVFALGVASRTELQTDLQEADAEKLRQFYVACTRAKQRLYLPLVIDEDKKRPKLGTASPMELFMTYVMLSLKHPCSILYDQNFVYEQIGDAEKALNYLIEASSGGIQASDLIAQENIKITPPPPKEIPSDAISSFNYKTLQLVSFSRFKEGQRAALPQGAARLPIGVETGTLLHELLAKIIKKQSFTNLEELVEIELFGTHLQGLEEDVTILLRRAFKAPLSCPQATFCLQDIDWNSSFCEREFFSQHTYEDSLVRGVIDLAFENDGYTFLIDWKSNWLGSTQEAYSQENMRRAVFDNHYNMQAQIYTQSWKRYLKSYGASFGGFFFIFLRGLEFDSGVHFFDERTNQK